MIKKNLILAAAVAGMLSGVTGNTSAKAEDSKDATKTEGVAESANPDKAACKASKKNKGHKCGGKMKKKDKEMGCKAGQCGSEMKTDEKPAADKPADTSAAPATGTDKK